jgi:hypothetical protein
MQVDQSHSRNPLINHLHDARFFGVARGPISLKRSEGKKNVTQRLDICYRERNGDMSETQLENSWRLSPHSHLLFSSTRTCTSAIDSHTEAPI